MYVYMFFFKGNLQTLKHLVILYMGTKHTRTKKKILPAQMFNRWATISLWRTMRHWIQYRKSKVYIIYSYSRNRITIYGLTSCMRVSFTRHKKVHLCALYEIQFSLYEDRHFSYGHYAAVFSIDMHYLDYHIGTHGNLNTDSR